MKKRSLEKLIKTKLRSTAGESLAEILIAMLVISLASIMLAGMVASSRNILVKSEDSYESMLGAMNDVEAGTDGSAWFYDITILNDAHMSNAVTAFTNTRTKNNIIVYKQDCGGEPYYRYVPQK